MGKKISLPIASKQPSAPAPSEDLPPGRAEGGTVAGDIERAVKSHPVVLFMKGSPDFPQCGFSARAASILQTFDVPLHHVDVLQDPEIRQGIKEFSDWPTIPQIYVGGEFLGGSDILLEMYENGELAETISGVKA